MPILLDGHATVTDNQANQESAGVPMSEEVKALVEKLRFYRMTPEEQREQAIDFAYGNGHFEDPRITREGIARAASEVDGQDEANSTSR
jgi:hypothetical protein